MIFQNSQSLTAAIGGGVQHAGGVDVLGRIEQVERFRQGDGRTRRIDLLRELGRSSIRFPRAGFRGRCLPATGPGERDRCSAFVLPNGSGRFAERDAARRALHWPAAHFLSLAWKRAWGKRGHELVTLGRPAWVRIWSASIVLDQAAKKMLEGGIRLRIADWPRRRHVTGHAAGRGWVYSA